MAASAERDGAWQRGSARGFLAFAGGFWSGPTRRRAMLWSGAALVLLLCNLVVGVGLNQWNRWFFDALERKDGATLLVAVAAFPVLIALGAAFAVAMVKARMTLQVSWRAWLTAMLLDRWLADERYYRLEQTHGAELSPEYRIAEDVRLATEPVVDLVIGFLNALLAAVTFISILLVVGGSITISGVTIPGYIALAAIAYAAAVSASAHLIGRPLVDRVADKNESEAQFRYELTHLRENAESIARSEGGESERRRARDMLAVVVSRWVKVIIQHCRLTWILNANAFFAGTLPLLLAAPKYLAGEMTLGAMMQLASAFTTVLGALNWFTENYIRLAEWAASARRVDQLRAALEAIDRTGEAPFAASDDAAPDAHQPRRVR